MKGSITRGTLHACLWEDWRGAFVADMSHTLAGGALGAGATAPPLGEGKIASGVFFPTTAGATKGLPTGAEPFPTGV